MRLKMMARATPVLAIALLAVACDNGFTGLNENPNAPSSVTPQYLFPNGITNIVGTVRGGGFDLTFTSLWAQQIAMDRFTDEDRYSMRPGNIDGWWSGFYSGGLEDFATILQQATPDSAPSLAAPALVMKSFTYGIMTDVWGDIPYSEANKGADGFTPKYDSQQDVYNGIFADLKSANDMLASGGSGPNYGNADLIYGGDMAKWQKFANSLRLRYALRLTKVDAATAQAQATAALAAGVFTSNDDNALLRWPGDGTNDSPIYNTFRTRDDQHMSQTLVDTLKHLYIAINGADTTFDPRLAVYADPVASRLPDTVYIGAPNGLQDDSAIAIGLSNTSRLGAAYRQRTSPSILMTYAEVLFDEAEMAARGWTAGDPAQLYNDGIRASMQYNGIPDATIAAYLASPRVAFNSAAGLTSELTQIALQKWIALFGEGSEAYAEYRRTGVPDLKPGPAVITNPQIVARRLTYSLAEQSFNNTNLQAAIANQKGASLNDRVWWDTDTP